MRKGIVMEVDERFLTLLTPEGEFLKAYKQKTDYLIGQEIDFSPVNAGQKKKSFFYQLPGKAVAAAVFALMVATASFLPLYGSNDVYAYMSIDVNPSVELAINDELEVINLEAYNPEGEQIISKLKNWKKKDLSIVSSQIIEEIKKQGYFLNHDEVVISTVYEEQSQPEVAKKLEANIEEIEDRMEKENLQLTVLQGTKEERESAHKQGITTGVLKEKQPKVEQKTDKKESKQDDTKSKNPSGDKSDNGKINKPKASSDNKQKSDQKEVKIEDKEQTKGQQKKTDEKDKGKKDKKTKEKNNRGTEKKKNVVNDHHDNDDEDREDMKNNKTKDKKDNKKKEDNEEKDEGKKEEKHKKNEDREDD